MGAIHALACLGHVAPLLPIPRYCAIHAVLQPKEKILVFAHFPHAVFPIGSLLSFPLCGDALTGTAPLPCGPAKLCKTCPCLLLSTPEAPPTKSDSIHSSADQVQKMAGPACFCVVQVITMLQSTSSCLHKLLVLLFFNSTSSPVMHFKTKHFFALDMQMHLSPLHMSIQC